MGEASQENNAKEVAFLRARIVEVSRVGDVAEMKYLLGISRTKRLLTASDESSRWSLLHFSCSRGFLDITRMLLEAGADPLTAVDKHGKTCLHIAIEHDRRDVVNLLLTRYPVKKWPRQSKLTLGQTSARAGRLAILQLLLKNGLDPNDRGIRGETPLHQASRHGHAGVIELLLQHGADVDARETWAGRTPLHYACQGGSLKAAIALIVKGGADAHLPDLSAAGHTPLEAAVVAGHRALSHRLVILLDSRQKTEEKRHALLETLAIASLEATQRETKLTRHRVSSLRSKVAAEGLLGRLEKQQLVANVRGQLTRANTRLRYLESQQKHLQDRENERHARVMVFAARRPSTCPIIPRNKRKSSGSMRVVESFRTLSGAASGEFASDGTEISIPVEQGEIVDRKTAVRTPCVRVVWGEGGGLGEEGAKFEHH